MTQSRHVRPALLLLTLGAGRDQVRAGMTYVVISLLAVAFAVGSVLHVRGEETSGRVEPVLATGVSRTWLLLANLADLATSIAAERRGSGKGFMAWIIWFWA